MSLFYKTTKGSIKLLAKILYGHRIFGSEHLPEGPAILAPNHNSFWDPPLVAISSPGEVAFLARATLFEHPLLSWSIRHLNAYPVTGTAQDLNSFKLVCSLLHAQKKVVIFPEGIRSSSGEITSFKSGVAMLAFRCHCPIVPVYISGTFEVWNRERKFPKLWGKTAVVFGTPIHYETFAQLPKKEGQEAMTQAVHDAIERLQQWFLAGAKGTPP